MFFSPLPFKSKLISFGGISYQNQLSRQADSGKRNTQARAVGVWDPYVSAYEGGRRQAMQSKWHPTLPALAFLSKNMILCPKCKWSAGNVNKQATTLVIWKTPAANFDTFSIQKGFTSGSHFQSFFSKATFSFSTRRLTADFSHCDYFGEAEGNLCAAVTLRGGCNLWKMHRPWRTPRDFPPFASWLKNLWCP